MSTKHFRAAGFAVIGAILGALVAVWWVGEGTRGPVDRAIEGQDGPTVRLPEPPGVTRTSPPPDPTLLSDGEAEGPPDTGDAGPSVPPLQRLSLQGASRGADRVVQLPTSGWLATRVASPVPWSGRLVDLVADDEDVVAVHTDGKRSHLVRWSPEGVSEVDGGASGHSPFFVQGTLHWLRGTELMREDPEGPVVVLTAPSLGFPAVSSDGYSLVVGKGLEFYDVRGSARSRLDLPEPLQHAAWSGAEVVFTRLSVGDADLWSWREGVLTARVDSAQAELRPAFDAEGALWYVVEDTPGVYDLVHGDHVVAPDVGLSTRQGPSLRGGAAVVAASEPGTVLLVRPEDLTEVITGLPSAVDPVWVGEDIVFGDADGLVRLQMTLTEG